MRRTRILLLGHHPTNHRICPGAVIVVVVRCRYRVARRRRFQRSLRRFGFSFGSSRPGRFIVELPVLFELTIPPVCMVPSSSVTDSVVAICAPVDMPAAVSATMWITLVPSSIASSSCLLVSGCPASAIVRLGTTSLLPSSYGAVMTLSVCVALCIAVDSILPGVTVSQCFVLPRRPRAVSTVLVVGTHNNASATALVLPVRTIP